MVNYHRTTSFREVPGPIKLRTNQERESEKADGLAIARKHLNTSSCLSFKTRPGFPTQDKAYARAEKKVEAITTELDS